MQAIILDGGEPEIMNVKDLAKHYKIIGYTEDLTEIRKLGVGLLYRAELDNQPMLEGLVGPMWYGGKLRYETPEIYKRLCE